MRQFRADQFVVLFQVHGDQAGAAHDLKFVHSRLLDFAFASGDYHIVAADPFGDVDNGCYSFALLNRDQVDDVFPFSCAASILEFIHA